MLFRSFYVVMLGCNKTSRPCDSSQSETIGFNIHEKIADTLLATDTAYQDYSIFFTANKKYSNIKWKIGNDSRSFSDPSVNEKVRVKPLCLVINEN